MCGEEYLFLVKMHPFIRKPIEIDPRFSDRIIDFSSYPDINELFYVTDILITDYSSNIYEFSLQEKPIIFFAFDKFEYELLRSVHRKLDEYAPGKVCLSFDEVIETIQNKDFEMEKLHKFINENFDNSTTFASDKVIDHILLKK
ncbi:MAG: teichoic acid biosynthesis protein, partial [Coprobacillus sp.]|nr:teichoic acid biosynthesis protein [Coprobacillus sp.]